MYIGDCDILQVGGLMQRRRNSRALVTVLQIFCINTLGLRQDGRHFAEDIFKCIFLNENIWISIKISLKFVAKVWVNNIPVLVQIMAWRLPSDKPLSEAMVVSFLTHICVTHTLSNRRDPHFMWKAKNCWFCIKQSQQIKLHAISISTSNLEPNSFWKQNIFVSSVISQI